MKDYIECKPIMLPIPNNKLDWQAQNMIGSLFCNRDGVLNIPRNTEDVIKSIQYFGNQPQHLYPFSDEEIKEGETGYDTKTKTFFRCRPSFKPDTNRYKRLEATTDKSLSLPLIPNSFIEEWVSEQGKIDKVKIKIHREYFFDGHWHALKGTSDAIERFIASSTVRNEVIILPIEDKTFSRKEVKKVNSDYQDFIENIELEDIPTFSEWFDKNYPI